MWTHLDTFSGIGGFALAARWTGRIETVQFVEIDPFCRRVLAKNFPGVPIERDVRTFTGYGRIDLLTGGFPCQPWSAAGKRWGVDDHRDLWPELARIVRVLRPRWTLFENVPGIIGMDGGLDRVLADLGESGYATGTVVIPAAAVGAYHRRDRVWIAAHRNEHGEPVGALDGNAGRGKLRRSGAEALRSVGESPHGLPGRMDGRSAFGPAWEDGVPRVTQHEENRVNKLKSLGNAIVPQVAYELLEMMLEVDDAVQ